jgi:hypothetical protein
VTFPTAHRFPASRVALLVAAVGTAALVLLDALVRDEPVPQDDDLIYERMAQEPLEPHTYVFAFRIAVPWLVHILPFDHDTSFSVLAWVMSGASGGVLFLLLDRLGMPRRVSIPLGIVLALSPPLLVASLRQGRNPDPLTILVMVTGTLFIVERRARALALTMFVGALNREAALFLGPFAYAVWAERVWDPAALRRVATATLPAVAAFVALRLAIPTVGREHVPGYGSLVGGRVDVLREAAIERPLEMLRRLATVFGPLWLVALPAFRHFWFARRGLVLVALCLVAFTFALDWGRIAALAAPVVYAAAAWTLARHPRWIVPTLAGCALVIAGYAAYMDGPGMTNLIEAGPPPYPVR